MDAFEFGFDSANVVKVNTVEKFEQKTAKQSNIVSIICFRKHSDGVLAKKKQEKGSDLTDEEREEILKKVDAKIAEKLGKPIESLTEVDRLDVSSPRFAMSRTHYIETNKVGTIRCLSTYNEAGEIVKKAQCCKVDEKEAAQVIATGIVVYPTDNNEVEMDLLAMQKQLKFYIWKLSAVKFKKIQSLYMNARNDKKPYIDLMVTLDGDPKYQKQDISVMGGLASFLREDTKSNGELIIGDGVRTFIKERGIKLFKNTEDVLGYKLDAAKLAEKLSGGNSGGNSAKAENQTQTVNYSNMIE